MQNNITTKLIGSKQTAIAELKPKFREYGKSKTKG